MKKISQIFAIILILSAPLFSRADDETPVEQKIDEQKPAATEKTAVPEEIKKEKVDTNNPDAQRIVNGMEATKAAKKPKRAGQSSNSWPDDLQKLNMPATDEGGNNSSFAAFREEFLKKLAQKDKGFLVASVDKKLKFLTGGYSDFKSFYSLDMGDANHSLVWDDLTKVLKLGGVFTPEGEFCAPYVYCLWPEGVKSNGMAAVIRDSAEVKKSPSKGSATVATIGREIVKTNYNGSASRAGWTSIETKDGVKGFLRNDDVRNPEDYRAWFKEKDGKWVMTTYQSGGF